MSMFTETTAPLPPADHLSQARLTTAEYVVHNRRVACFSRLCRHPFSFQEQNSTFHTKLSCYCDKVIKSELHKKTTRLELTFPSIIYSKVVDPCFAICDRHRKWDVILELTLTCLNSLYPKVNQWSLTPGSDFPKTEQYFPLWEYCFRVLSTFVLFWENHFRVLSTFVLLWETLPDYEQSVLIVSVITVSPVLDSIITWNGWIHGEPNTFLEKIFLSRAGMWKWWNITEKHFCS
jgi:hypothetical protein